MPEGTGTRSLGGAQRSFRPETEIDVRISTLFFSMAKTGQYLSSIS